jgi:hypothetical protein
VSGFPRHAAQSSRPTPPCGHRPGGRCPGPVTGASLEALERFDDVLARWIDAEARGDAATLDALLDDEFRGDGLDGYVLTKAEWLDRYRRGELVNDAFDWRPTRIRAHAGAVVAMGVQAQSGAYRGVDCGGRFQSTLVAVPRGGRWAIVNMQLKRLEGSSDAS